MNLRNLTAVFMAAFLALAFQNASAMDITEAQKVKVIHLDTGIGLKTIPLNVTYLDSGYFKWAYIIHDPTPNVPPMVLLLVKGDLGNMAAMASGGRNEYQDLGDLSNMEVPQSEIDKTLNKSIYDEVMRINILRELQGFPMVTAPDGSSVTYIRLKCIENTKYTCAGYVTPFFQEKGGWTFFKGPDSLLSFFTDAFSQMDKMKNFVAVNKLVSVMRAVFQPKAAIVDLQGFYNKNTLDVTLTDPFGVTSGILNERYIVAINKMILASNYAKTLKNPKEALLPMPRLMAKQ